MFLFASAKYRESCLWHLMLELSVTAYNVICQLMHVQLVLILLFFLYYLDSCIPSVCLRL